MKKVLYISSLGMGEALGQSQVWEYLKGLSSRYGLFLYSFEKETTKDKIERIKEKMADDGISWYFQPYSNRYGIISTLFQILSSVRELRAIVKTEEIELIHARSLVPMVMALYLKRFYGVKVLFDIRGFQVDEKAEVGRITKGSLLFKMLKNLEHYAYAKSDALVTLTNASIPYLVKYISKDKITVIPTCANEKLFRHLSLKEKDSLKEAFGYRREDKILIHTGAVANWYDFDSELQIISSLMAKDKDIRYLILNRAEHRYINEKLQEYHIPKDRVRLKSVAFEEVYGYLNISDASIFIIKPTFSKKASAPTKFAENLSCGLDSITNVGIGDMDYFLTHYDVGYLLDVDMLECDLERISKEILERVVAQKELKAYQKCYEAYFSKDKAVEMYAQIYDRLLR